MVCKLDGLFLELFNNTKGSNSARKTYFHSKHKKLFHLITSLEALQKASHLQVLLHPHSAKPVH